MPPVDEALSEVREYMQRKRGMKDQLGDAPYPPAEFHGETFNYSRDYERLADQAKLVAQFLSDGQWHTLAEIKAATNVPEASASARYRDMKAAGFPVEKEYVARGLWRYRLVREQVA